MEPCVTFTDNAILEGAVPWERPPEGLPLAPILVETLSVPIPEELEGTKVPDSGVPLPHRKQRSPLRYQLPQWPQSAGQLRNLEFLPLHQKQNGPLKN